MIAAKAVWRSRLLNVVFIWKNFLGRKSILTQATCLPPPCCLTNRNRGSFFPSAAKTCKRQSQYCKITKFHFNNLAPLAATSFTSERSGPKLLRSVCFAASRPRERGNCHQQRSGHDLSPAQRYGPCVTGVRAG